MTTLIGPRAANGIIATALLLAGTVAPAAPDPLTLAAVTALPAAALLWSLRASADVDAQFWPLCTLVSCMAFALHGFGVTVGSLAYYAVVGTLAVTICAALLHERERVRTQGNF